MEYIKHQLAGKETYGYI
jgi:hypothetical protein